MITPVTGSKAKVPPYSRVCKINRNFRVGVLDLNYAGKWPSRSSTGHPNLKLIKSPDFEQLPLEHLAEQRKPAPPTGSLSRDRRFGQQYGWEEGSWPDTLAWFQLTAYLQPCLHDGLSMWSIGVQNSKWSVIYNTTLPLYVIFFIAAYIVMA